MTAYRSTPHPSTGYTPNMLKLGREVYISNQLIFPLPSVDEVDQDSYVSEVRDKLADSFHLAGKHLNDSAVCHKRNYDTRWSQDEFPVSSLVYKYNNFCIKIEEKWSGPFVVKQILNPVLYKIQNCRKNENVHLDRLMLYKSDDAPARVNAIQN